jgi:CRISPR/Cas system Type II protein with McrA/HNH and RuvC-like nuclease domain
MAALRAGKAPVITRGPYSKEVVEVDHIIPRAVVQELDDKLFNLEFMPMALNREKSAKIGVRQRQLAEKWRKLELLSEAGFRAVMAADK